MNISPGHPEFSVGITLDPQERFLVDYRSSGEQIEVNHVRAFIDLRTGKVNNVVAFGQGIKADGVMGGGRSRKLRHDLIPQHVLTAIHESWDAAAEEISDVEGLVFA